MHPLDRPIWSALTTRQAHLAEVNGPARRFPPAVTGLGSLDEVTPAAWRALADLLAPGETVGLLLDGPADLPGSLALVDAVPCAQMVHVDDAKVAGSLEGAVELGARDVPEMVDLATRTKPGPFGTRTYELGRFLGFRAPATGTLMAMSGERMRVPGMTEVSGVCTDPAYTGRGLAAQLVAEGVRRIRATGEQAYLHVKAANARAIALYERLGFVHRAQFQYTIVRRS
jgi:ribosomal protein S18 acetylase RimI-like enzyme